MADIDIWRDQKLIDQLDLVLRDETRFDLVLAQIPGLFGTSEKATYLGFRAVGLTRAQAFDVLGLPQDTYDVWVEETPQLEEFEYRCLTDLQSRISADIVRLGFLRNMTMFMFKDQNIIRKGMGDLESMTPRDFTYMRTVRKYYSMHDLLALEKAIAPEKHRDQTLILTFGGNGFEVIDDDVDKLRLVSEDSNARLEESGQD